jgi:hypothetical protein
MGAGTTPEKNRRISEKGKSAVAAALGGKKFESLRVAWWGLARPGVYDFRW